MKKLIGMTDYVLEQDKTSNSMGESFFKRRNYANFLKQPLTLEIFIATDENGNVLEEPKDFTITERDGFKTIEKYYKAKDKVIFEGFDIHYRDEQIIILCNKNNDIVEFATNGSVYVFDEYSAETIEDLIFYAKKENVDLTLTDNVKI